MTNKKDFPILRKDLHYLDNAATAQKPKIVIDTLKGFYETTNANAHRGLYNLAEKATEKIEEARATISKFIGAEAEEIVFTKNATESLNLASRALADLVKKGDNIVATELEHHANFIPWQQLAKNRKAGFRVAKYNKKTHQLEDIAKLVDKNTKIVAFTQMSNVTGQATDVKKIISAIRKKNSKAIIIVDGAQGIVHIKTDIKKLGCDIYALSMHKIYGPAGIGILYAKKDLLKKMNPFLFGGHMIDKVTIKETTWADAPDKFEAGTLDFSIISEI